MSTYIENVAVTYSSFSLALASIYFLVGEMIDPVALVILFIFVIVLEAVVGVLSS